MLSSLPARLVALLVLTSSAFELVLAANNCRVDVPASQDIYECVRVSIDSLEAAEERMLSLTPLSSPTDYDIDDGRGGTIKLNICRSVVTEVYRLDDPSSVGIYREVDGSGQSLGSSHSDPVVLPPPKGEPEAQSLSLTYPAGSDCPAGDKFSSVLVLQCDTSVYGAGHPILAGTSDGGCAHFFLWRTPVACSHPPSRGIGAALLVFGIVLLVALIVFYGSSVVYNRLVLHKRGKEQFPSLAAVSSIARSLFERARGLADRLRGRSRPGGFRGLDEYEEETNLFDDDVDEY